MALNFEDKKQVCFVRASDRVLTDQQVVLNVKQVATIYEKTAESGRGYKSLKSNIGLAK